MHLPQLPRVTTRRLPLAGEIPATRQSRHASPHRLGPRAVRQFNSKGGGGLDCDRIGVSDTKEGHVSEDVEEDEGKIHKY